jgi:hypothetical protein
LLALSLCAVFVKIPSVKAYSTETTGSSAYGFDTTYCTSCQCAGFNIFALDNKLVFYDNNAQIQGTYGLTWSYGSDIVYTNTTRTSIITVNSTNILIGSVIDYLNYGSYYIGIHFKILDLNVNTLISSIVQETDLMTSVSSAGFGIQTISGTGGTFLSVTNSSGTFFWYMCAGSITTKQPNTGYATQLSYCGYTPINGIYQQSYSSEIASTSNCYIYPSSYAFYSVNDNLFYIICDNNYQNSVRANIYSYNLYTTISLIGTTGIDNSYTGDYSTDTSNSYAGMVYVIGNYYYSDSTTELNEINIAYSLDSTYAFNIGTIIFNSTYISFSGASAFQSVNTNSYIARPFTIAVPINSYGNSSGSYSVAVFTNTFSTIVNGKIWVDSQGRWIVDTNGYYYATETGYIKYTIAPTITLSWVNSSGTFLLHQINVSNLHLSQSVLTGFSYTLSGLETGTPIWVTQTIPNIFFLYTPNLPQAFYYPTSLNIMGYELNNNAVGIEIDGLNSRCVAQLFYAVNPNFQFEGLLTGDIYTNAQISVAPIQIGLQQGITYTYTGEIYFNSLLYGSGSFSIGISSLSTSTNIFSSYDMSYTTDTFSGGTFSFNILLRNTAQTVYQVMIVNFTLSTGDTSQYIYDLGFWNPNSGGTNNPYTPIPSSNGGNNGGGFSGTSTINTNLFMLILFFLIIVIPMGSWFGNYGFYFGLIFATIVTYMAGFLPVWGLFLMVIGLGLIGYQFLGGSGIINSLPQIPESPHLSDRNKNKEGSE